MQRTLQLLPRRAARVAPLLRRELRVVSRARSGRVPPTPSVDAHPLVALSGTTLADACTAWRRGAGSGAVLSQFAALLGPDAATALRALPLPQQHTAAGQASEPRLLITGRQPALQSAFQLEVQAASPGAARLGTGMFVAAGPVPPRRMACMTALRAQVNPLAVAPDAESLLDAIAEIDVGAVPLAKDFDWLIHSEAVSRHPRHMHKQKLKDAVRQLLYRHDAVADVAPVPPGALQLLVLETEAAMLFGLVEFAPSADADEADWAKCKLHNFCGGITADLAALAVNVATRCEPGAVLGDPCCGSGTILYTAWERGMHAVGGDIQPALVAHARANLAAFGPAVGRTQARRAADAAEREAPPAPPPPVVVQHDAASAVLTPAPAAIVSNLPYGRWVPLRSGDGAVLGGDGSGDARFGVDDDGLDDLLRNLLPQAPRHCFFAGEPLAPRLRRLGYRVAAEVSVDAVDRRFMAVCCCDGGDAGAEGAETHMNI